MFSSNTTQVSNAANYIEDVFSTYLYTGNGSTQTITNGIDLSTYGGMVITKARSIAYGNILVDTTRGVSNILQTSTTNAQIAESTAVTGVSTTGFSVGSYSNTNGNGQTFASWTFRKQPKFFDVVTYTGDGTSGRAISHNLESTPGCIIVKITSAAGSWPVFHRSLGGGGTTENLTLNTTAAVAGNAYFPAVSSTTFSVSASSAVNSSGATYVAYLFAHDAGGFGLTGTDNVISCGSYTGSLSVTPVVTLGYEPQFVMVKKINATGNWQMMDSMSCGYISANLTNAQAGIGSWMNVSGNNFVPTATGFSVNTGSSDWNSSGATYIYIAIRRGPMKVPTSGTSVFEPVTSTSANFIKGTLEASDMGWFKDRATVADWFVGDRLRGIMSYYNRTLYTNLTNAEATPTTGDTVTSTSSEGTDNGKIYFGGAGATTDQPLGYSFKRAPSFFDEVCYTGTGSARTVTHNLGVAPELMIVKRRDNIDDWGVYAASYPSAATGYFKLNTTQVFNVQSGAWNNTAPTASVFTVGNNAMVNASGGTYVAYLFATCAGVSKIGSYTGNGSSQTINCGFTSGARFILIKSTSTTGNWGVFDTARGITSGNDPCLRLNTTAAEDSGPYVGPDSTGFTVGTDWVFNESGVTYIFLAIA